ncbi:ThiJ/PfpI family protein [Tricharina praecox]|uniref:ThiJ/PfpI family protein n=1 Tax=Tricharina praecox TaxID=43433 RepID=UPI002220F712|nr:ThiJ/PfpI family protein [Tricharina praecox]KAI5857153.1 ThiJ/PfpI family protein [Tricharina praecox]
MSAKKVLIVLSSRDSITVTSSDGSTRQQATGFFLKELAQPLLRLLAAGYTPVFANADGSKPALDPLSDNALWFLSFTEKAREKELLEKMAVERNFAQPKRFAELRDQQLQEFAGVFVPGGHAPMEDLGVDTELGRIMGWFHEKRLPTAVICHGPIALLSAHSPADPDSFPYKGYKVTCYSNKEEITNEFMWGGKLPRCEDALKEVGCDVETPMVPLMPKVVVDRELVSGNGPTSADQLGEKFVEMLEKGVGNV